MTERNNIPDVRFEGFNNEWNICELGNLANFSKGQGYSKNDLTEEGTPIILYGRLYTNYQTIISEVETRAIEKKGSILSNGYEVVVPASGETAEDIARASAIVTNGILIGGDLNIVYPDKEIDSVFLALNISNGKEQKELIKRAQGKSVVHLRNGDLKAVRLCYPNKDEQIKIGTYFQNLDKLITLHQNKYKKLVTLKKAMLEKMFPKNGEAVPEIRFKGFDEAWEDKLMDNIYNKIRNAFVGTATPYYVNDGYFYLESNNVKDGQINRNSEVFINENFYLKQKENWLHTGDLVMVQSGHVGHCAVIPPHLDNTAAHALIIFTNAKIKINSYFLNYQLQTVFAKKKIDIITIGNTIKHILSSDMKEFCLSIPTFEEQVKIACYFQSLDKLISIHQKELDKLKNLKKACLEKMFV